jgi:hypothetical protein
MTQLFSTHFRIYNSNSQHQKKFKVLLNPLNRKTLVDVMKFPLNYLKLVLRILNRLLDINLRILFHL